MGIISSWKAKSAAKAHDESVRASAESSLTAFLGSHSGVEAWLEEAAGINRESILLVAGSGEWNRRVVPSLDWARKFCAKRGIPVFQAGIVPYPQRMRDWNERHRIKKERPEF